MNEIQPVYICGRWVVLCPKHGARGAMDAEEEYICPECYPKSIAVLFKLENGVIVRKPDVSARKTARILAEQNDEVYRVVKPEFYEQIESELSDLPVKYQNWRGEPLEDLKKSAARIRHIIENYEKRNKRLDG